MRAHRAPGMPAQAGRERSGLNWGWWYRPGAAEAGVAMGAGASGG